MPIYSSHQDLLLYIHWKVWEQGWQTREILPQFCRTGEGTSCCCGKDTKLYSYPSLKRKKKGLHLFVPVDRQKPIVVGEKANKVLCNYEGIRGNHLGSRPLKVFYMICSIQKVMKCTKRQGEKKKAHFQETKQSTEQDLEMT